jgi:Protein of unknown function, DUF481
MNPLRRLTALVVPALLCLSGLLQAQTAAPKPTPDILVFSNGDQLTGKLERMAGGSVVFKSDMAGELTISSDKIKELHSGDQFALLRKGAPLTKKTEHTVPSGTVQVADGNVVLTSAAQAPETVPIKDVAYLVDKPSFDKQVNNKVGFLHGWNGVVTGGATVVRATQNGTTLTAGISLVRMIPQVSWLPPDNRTTFNLMESYGKLTTPVIPPPVQPPPPTPQVPTSDVVKTSIFHTDAERDEYFSPRLYALGDISFDHNFSQGLQFQQVYGGGIGWTPILDAKQELDLKADIHYESQQFIQTLGTANQPNINMIGSTFAETYRRTLPYKILFTEAGDILPGWSNSNAYSANATATLALPVYKRLSASFTTTDNFLNNPAQYYKKNSYQFITGVTYTLH